MQRIRWGWGLKALPQPAQLTRRPERVHQMACDSGIDRNEGGTFFSSFPIPNAAIDQVISQRAARSTTSNLESGTCQPDKTVHSRTKMPSDSRASACIIAAMRTWTAGPVDLDTVPNTSGPIMLDVPLGLRWVRDSPSLRAISGAGFQPIALASSRWELERAVGPHLRQPCRGPAVPRSLTT